MDLSNFFLSIASKFLRLQKLPDRWEAIKHLGKSNSLDIPTELIGLNLDLLSRSFYNINAIQPNLDWVWPYWVEKQYDAQSTSFLPASYLSINLTHRNWVAFSSPESNFEAIVDPRGLLTPLLDSWSVDFWIKTGDYVILPSKLTYMEQYLVNHAPIIKNMFYKKNVKATSQFLMHYDEKNNYIVGDYYIDDYHTHNKSLSFYIAIRPYNPESIIPIFSIEYNEKKNAFKINNKDWLFLKNKPDRVFCSNQENGDSHKFINSKDQCFKIKDKSGLCSAIAEFKIKKEEAFNTQIIIPQTQGKEKTIKKIFNTKFSDLENSIIKIWNQKKSLSLKIQTPDSNINNAFESSKNNLLVLLDEKELPPGPFTYHKMWFRDASYSITALLKLGFHNDVKRLLTYYFSHQEPSGYFLSQNGEWDSNGQVLWTISQYYKFSQDKKFILHHMAALKKACLWIFQQTNKTKKDIKTLHYGLLPPGFSAEHFGPSNYYYWDDFWAYAGIRDFIEIAESLGENITNLKSKNQEFLKNIKNSIKRVQTKIKEKYIPSSPYRRKDSSIIGSLVAIYPLQILDPNSEEVRNTLKIIKKKYMKQGGFFHRLMHSGLNVYLTAHVAESFLMQKAFQTIPIFQWILKNATSTFTYPEAIHPETEGGCMGDGHHGWATSELIHLTRNFLFYEKESTLIFFPMMPSHWLDIDNKLIVDKAYSAYGQFNFSLKTTSEHVIFKFKMEKPTQPPKKLEINFPVIFDSAKINNTVIAEKKKTLTLPYKEELEIYFKI